MLKSPDKKNEETCEPCRSAGRKILKSIDYVSCGIGPIGMVAILVMMVLTVIDVVLRWFGSAIVGTMEITELLLGLMAFFSFSWCYCKDKHIKIEVLTEHFPHRVRCVTNLLGALMGLVLFSAVMWGSFGFALEAYESEEFSPLLKIPLFLVKFGVMIASCLFFLQLLSSAIDRAIRAVKGD